MKKHIAVLVAGLALGYASSGLAGLAHGEPDRFAQRNFPCQEDEALMYSPLFGPDRVGCLNIEEMLP